VGEKKNNVWFMYAYHRESGEIVAYRWGKGDMKTVQKLRKRIQGLRISYDRMMGTAFFRHLGKTATRQGKSTG
jgi:IS1 family transposase